MSANVVVASPGLKKSTGGSIDLPEHEHLSQDAVFAPTREGATRLSLCIVEDRVSQWSQSVSKRLFDVGCVLVALPFLLPAIFIIGLAVRLTSKGPVFFKQTRIGTHRRNFTILKFRTMEHREARGRSKVTTASNQPFTPVGPFLRRWKLDELPQLFNVLIGNMSLVGPRPKLPEHQLAELTCRPGITGAATIAFAREEHILANLPNQNLDDFYRAVILPAKLQLDREYMLRATAASDLKLIVDTILRRWDHYTVRGVLEIDPAETPKSAQKPKVPAITSVSATVLSISGDESLASGD